MGGVHSDEAARHMSLNCVTEAGGNADWVEDCVSGSIRLKTRRQFTGSSFEAAKAVWVEEIGKVCHNNPTKTAILIQCITDALESGPAYADDQIEAFVQKLLWSIRTGVLVPCAKYTSMARFFRSGFLEIMTDLSAAVKKMSSTLLDILTHSFTFFPDVGSIRNFDQLIQNLGTLSKTTALSRLPYYSAPTEEDITTAIANCGKLCVDWISELTKPYSSDALEIALAWKDTLIYAEDAYEQAVRFDAVLAKYDVVVPMKTEIAGQLLEDILHSVYEKMDIVVLALAGFVRSDSSLADAVGYALFQVFVGIRNFCHATSTNRLNGEFYSHFKPVVAVWLAVIDSRVRKDVHLALVQDTEFLTFDEEETDEDCSTFTQMPSAEALVVAFGQVADCYLKMDWPYPQENYVILMQVLEIMVDGALLYIDLITRYLTHSDGEKLENPQTWSLHRMCKVLKSGDFVCTEMLTAGGMLHSERIIEAMERSQNPGAAQSVRRNVGKFVGDANENFCARLLRFMKIWLDGQQLYYEIRMFVYSFCKASLTMDNQKSTVNSFIYKLDSIKEVMQQSSLRWEIIHLFLTELWEYLLSEFQYGVVALDKVAESMKHAELYFRIVYAAIIEIRDYLLKSADLSASAVFSQTFQKVEKLYSLRRLTISELITTFYLEQFRHQTAANLREDAQFGTIKFLACYIRDRETLIFEVLRYENQAMEKIDQDFLLRMRYRAVPAFEFSDLESKCLTSTKVLAETASVVSPFGKMKCSLRISPAEFEQAVLDILPSGLWMCDLYLGSAEDRTGHSAMFLGCFYVAFHACQTISDISYMMDVKAGSVNLIHTAPTEALNIIRARSMWYPAAEEFVQSRGSLKSGTSEPSVKSDLPDVPKL